MASAYDLERNDIDGAVRVYRSIVLDPKTTRSYYEDQVAILLQLQDDSSALEKKLDAVDKDKTIAAVLKKLGI